MKRERNSSKLISLFMGILISLTVVISVCFPDPMQEIALATATHIPDSGLSQFLEYLRRIMNPAYGIFSSSFALMAAWIINKNYGVIIQNRYNSISLYLLSIVFAVFNVFGLFMYHIDSLPMFTDVLWLMVSLFLVVGWSIIFYLASILLFRIFDDIIPQWITGSDEDKNENNLCFVLRTAGIILLCWMVWIIPYFPASMDNDVFSQLRSWLIEPNDHHPWFSTCILGLCYNIGHFFGSDNAGIFIYILLRDVLISLIFASVVWTLKKKGFRKSVYYTVMLFYAITPFFGAYAKHAFKDTIGMGLFCACILTMFLLVDSYHKGCLVTSLVIQHGIVLIITCLTRHNSIYALLPAELIIIAMLFLNKQWKRAIILLVMILCFFTYQRSLGFFNIRHGSMIEAASIPCQQIARVYRDHKEDLSEEDRKQLESIFEEDKLSQYDPVISDKVKASKRIDITMSEAAPVFLRLYGKWLRRYPVTFLEAAVAQSYAYYSFTPRLPEKSGNWNSGMAIFDWIGCNSGYEKEFDLHYIDGFYGMRTVLQASAKVWDKIPVFCLTDICAVYTWLITMAGYYLLRRWKIIYFLPVLSLIMMIGTCIASPVNDCFRYYSPVAASFPVMLCILASSEERRNLGFAINCKEKV